jgi:hypothetical protein
MRHSANKCDLPMKKWKSCAFGAQQVPILITDNFSAI